MDAFTRVIQATVDKLCPNRVIRLSRSTDVIDQALEKAKKKRKRLRKAFNKEPSDNLANKIQDLNKEIKRKIFAIKKTQINTKLHGRSPKSFWQAIADLEGKNHRDEIELDLNGKMSTDSLEISEAFADFFSRKVENLLRNAGQSSYFNAPSGLVFNSEEITKAAKKLKPKYCCGEDGIAMRVVKDFATLFPDTIVQIFNTISHDRIPSRWKTAIVTPLFKAGNKNAITQYRPISNLDSFGKLYEKVILHRLDEYGEQDGTFQHGFKPNRSTVTAMLEMQDFVATELDKGNIVGTYSLDLSAAFDLLRPDILQATLSNVISPGLLNTIMDFLSERKFCVEVNGKRSNAKSLKVGCVQGSILGPRLFTLYLRNLQEIIPQAFVVSYADDTYVSISAKTIEEVKSNITNTMTLHDDYLNRIGMVTNVNKTELIYFARKTKIKDPITVKNAEIHPVEHMKVLGVLFSSDLTWDKQVERMALKARVILAKLKLLSRFLNAEDMAKVVTSHLFGFMYYGLQA